MKHLIIATLILFSLISRADGGNGVERIELPKDVRTRIASYLANHCGLPAASENTLSVYEYSENEDGFTVTLELSYSTGEINPIVRMKFVNVDIFSAYDDQMMMVETNYQGLCN